MLDQIHAFYLSYFHHAQLAFFHSIAVKGIGSLSSLLWRQIDAVAENNDCAQTFVRYMPNFVQCVQNLLTVPDVLIVWIIDLLPVCFYLIVMDRFESLEQVHRVIW